ncbi:MAG: acyltransferase family protein [Luteibaculaceae bacterium]
MNIFSRNSGLDLLRAIAVFLVLMQHAGLNPTKLELGRFGVDLFFVLSGFLIGGILLRDFDKYNGKSTLFNFWKRRWFRTLPLYYLALFVQIYLSGNFQKEYLYYFVFLQNNFYGISLFGVSWSLVIEEWFYLTLPFLFLVFVKYFGQVRITHLLISIIILILIKIIFIYFRDTPLDGINSNILLRYDSMLFGVLLACIKKEKSGWFHKMANGYLFLIAIITLFILLLNSNDFNAGFNTSSLAFLFRSIYFTLISLLIMFLIPYLYQFKLLDNPRIFTLKFIVVWTSVLSYGLYLFHMNIFSFTKSLNLSDKKLKFSLDLLICYLVCYLLYVSFERPLTNLRDKKLI